VHVVEDSSNFVLNEDMLYGSVCSWCSYLKDELQISVSEVKSLLEIKNFERMVKNILVKQKVSHCRSVLVKEYQF